MGCGCGSLDVTVEAPDEIIADPSATDVCTFTIKQAGKASRDYTVYQGESTAKEAKWFVLNWSDPEEEDPEDGHPGVIEVENFIRIDEADKNKGQVLWRGVLKYPEDWEQKLREPGMSLLEMGFNGWMGAAGGDPYDDDYYVHRHERHEHDYMCTAFINWTMRTEALLTTTMRKGFEGFEGPLTLGVFARGTALARYYEVNEPIYADRVVGQDDEGEDIIEQVQCGERSTLEKDEDNYVDFVQFALLKDNEPVHVNGAPCVFTVPGDATDWPNNFVTPLFTTEQGDGGWFTKDPVKVVTHEGIDPTLALLIAHLMTTQYSSFNINRSFPAEFPDDPRGGLIGGAIAAAMFG